MKQHSKDVASSSRIAVVAVHGVGDQAPNAMARAIANLLLHLNRGKGQVQYTPFEEDSLRISSRPVVFQSQLESHKRRWHEIPERSSYIRALHDAKSPPQGVKLDEDFMKGQLVAYKGEGPSGAYQTLRIEGARLDTPGDRQHLVHIYEMYWADISRLTSGWLRVLAELYQLLFQVASLGRKTVDFALASDPTNPWWRAARLSQSWAVRCYTWPVPILNLFLLATILLMLPGYLSDQSTVWDTGIGWGLLGLFMISAMGWLWTHRDASSFLLWVTPPFLTLLAIVVGYWLFNAPLQNEHARFGYQHLLALEWVFLMILALGWVIKKYDMLRPGAAKFGTIAGVVVGCLFIAKILESKNSRSDIAAISLYLSERIFLPSL